jgi:hypothetical protein
MLREPDDMLFIRRDIYRWRALDEWAVAAHHLGKFKEALDLYRRLLENAQIPAEDRGRISRNEALCAAKLT